MIQAERDLKAQLAEPDLREPLETEVDKVSKEV